MKILQKILLMMGLCSITAFALANKPNVYATIHTNLGNIKLELNKDKAPTTVDNFIHYAKSGFYNNTIFHRVIDGFMIQGGGMTKDLIEKSTKEPIKNEADNGLKNTEGTIAMARTQDPHSATAQFFINVKDNDALNYTEKTDQGWGYAVFGKVVNGMDVVDKIKKVSTHTVSAYENVPNEAIIITSVNIEKK